MTGCPCGCLSKPGYYDDPDCARFGPILPEALWPDYEANNAAAANA